MDRLQANKHALIGRNVHTSNTGQGRRSFRWPTGQIWRPSNR
jgi:hypothetical protein